MLCQTCQSVFDAAENRISKRRSYDITAKSHHNSYEDLMQSAQQHCYVCRDTLDALSNYYPNLGEFQLETPLLYANIFREEDDDYCIIIKLEIIQWDKPPFNTRNGKQVNEIYLKRVSKEPAPIPISLGNSTDIDNCGAIINHWLSKCTRTHSACGAVGQPNWCPTRLLDLGNYPEDHGSRIRIVHTGVHDLGRPYLTLSHCWGSADIPKLTARQSSPTIPINDLPKTYKDAISIASFLGISYLWIDSLCIRQDSKEDWEKEAAVMNKVYENAFCNIAATASRDGHGGLFYERDPILLEPCQFVYKQQVFQLVSKRQWESGVDYAPLNKRGWVVQERWFSPRIIHFSRDQLFWECKEMVACESFPDSPPICGSLPLYENFKGGQRDSALQERASPEEELTRVWIRLVRRYSYTTLTVKSDKLVAISGLASAIQGYTKDEYLAGLWRRDIIPQLAWFTLGGWSENFLDTLGTESYTAPSWSWASVSRPVGISAPQDTKGEWGYREISTLIDYGVDLKGSTITGAVCGGFLRVQGPLRRVFVISRHGGTRGSYQLAADGRTSMRQTVVLDVELNDHVVDLFFLCLYRTKARDYNSPVLSDVSETDDNSEVIDDDSKNAGDDIHVIGDNSQEVRNGLEDADNDSEDKDHGSGDVGEGSGSIGDDWADEAVSLWDTSDDPEVPGNGWDDTGNDNTGSIIAKGLLLRPVPGEIGKFYRVGFFEVYGTRASWWFSAPKPEVYLSSVDFLPGIGYTITII